MTDTERAQQLTEAVQALPPDTFDRMDRMEADGWDYCPGCDDWSHPDNRDSRGFYCEACDAYWIDT